MIFPRYIQDYHRYIQDYHRCIQEYLNIGTILVVTLSIAVLGSILWFFLIYLGPCSNYQGPYYSIGVNIAVLGSILGFILIYWGPYCSLSWRTLYNIEEDSGIILGIEFF